jgi:ribonuclease Z
MGLKITILGNNSARPLLQRHPAAQVVYCNDEPFLIDCGEGTQVQMLRYRVKSWRINHIFISHLHGDHYLGLMGLLDTYALSDRQHPLHIYAPAPLQTIIQAHLSAVIPDATYPYPLIFHPTDNTEKKLLYEGNHLSIYSVPLVHNKIHCTGFVFEEKKAARKMRKDKIEEYQIPFILIDGIKKGKHFELPDGKIIPNEELTTDSRIPQKYAYCSDTAYTESLLPYLQNVDLLYHESTYLNDKIQQAQQRGHSTAEQAATIAQKANVKRLLLGHYSTSYYDLLPFLTEARPAFAQTYLSQEGATYDLSQTDWSEHEIKTEYFQPQCSKQD